MKPENEHIEVHEIRGFVASTLAGAMREAEAIRRGTQCRQFLYSLSLSPPETERVPVSIFEDAIDRIEEKLGLAGHSRVIVFHEKRGRRHAHCVWSRINAESMTAVRMSHDRKKLSDISRELYFEHGWKMPEGLIDPELCNPLNFDRHEWFKAKRVGKDPRDIKAVSQQCWASSDSGKAFRYALEQRGYHLAAGDRRDVVAVDIEGQVYAVARWTGLRTRDLVARLNGILGELPSVLEAKERIAGLVQQKLTGFLGGATAEFARAAQTLEARRITMVERHSAARRNLQAEQDAAGIEEAKRRAARFRKGLSGLWDRVTGRHAQLRATNEREAAEQRLRNASQKQSLIDRQLDERQNLQAEIMQERWLHTREITRLHRQIAGDWLPEDAALPSTETKPELAERRRRRGRTFTPM